jgi:DNA polymerase-3 subunit gamma/tau
VEQFVIDLAGYYRNLLLLKNGVNREAVLGYPPDRFSAPVLQALDSIHLERALSILLDLYRDIRYSVSPRFELETAISKLCWLTQWVSPRELRAAVAEAREVLGGAPEGPAGEGGIARPLAGPGRNRTPAETGPAREGAGENPGTDQSGAFSEGFKRYMAARESAGPSPAAEEPFFGEAPGTGEPEGRETEAGEPPSPPGSIPEGDAAARLKAALIKGFKTNRGLLASGLERSLPWEWSGDKLIIPVRDTLGVELLKKNAALIQEALVRIWGRPLSFEVVVGNHPGEAPPEKTPALSPQVELVCRVFRGTVIKNDGSML